MSDTSGAEKKGSETRETKKCKRYDADQDKLAANGIRNLSVAGVELSKSTQHDISEKCLANGYYRAAALADKYEDLSDYKQCHYPIDLDAPWVTEDIYRTIKSDDLVLLFDGEEVYLLAQQLECFCEKKWWTTLVETVKDFCTGNQTIGLNLYLKLVKMKVPEEILKQVDPFVETERDEDRYHYSHASDYEIDLETGDVTFHPYD